MRLYLKKALAAAALAIFASGAALPAYGQSYFTTGGTSFQPAGGIVGAIPNLAAGQARGLVVGSPVRVVNGRPIGGSSISATMTPSVSGLNAVNFATERSGTLLLPGSVPMNGTLGQPYCTGFARASDGSLVATSGGGFDSMILGQDCNQLINSTLMSGGNVVFTSSVLFRSGSDHIPSYGKRALKMTADVIRNAGGLYEVSGYASREGNQVANDYLSWRRAKAASYYLIGQGASANQLNVVGKGETSRFGPEFAANRRIVVRRKG